MNRDDADAAAGDDVLGPRVEQALAAALRPVALEPDRAARLRARVLSRVQREPQPPRALFTLRDGEGEWTAILPDVERKVLFEDAAARTRSVLIRLGPGAQIPPHGHGEHEECLVLEGELCIGELLLRAGDYHLAPAGARHPVVRSETGALIFLREALPEIDSR